MKYKNATKVLPADLIKKIQQYIQGEYIYIPIESRVVKSYMTDYGLEIQKRDEHIYTNHLEGVKNTELARAYSLSESSIRRIIIKQRKRYNELKDQIELILSSWSIAGMEIKQIYDSAWQIGEDYVLKVYDNRDMLERNIRILSILSNLNVPVGGLIPNKMGAMYSIDENHYYILTERLKGNNIVNIENPDRIGFEMGRIIGELHKAFLQCEKLEDFWDNSLLAEMKGWIENVFTKDGWSVVKKEQFRETLKQLEQLYSGLPVQLIHRDVHFGNFLFCDGVFSGYIDFDLSQRNIRIFDLCYFVLGLFSEEEVIDITEKKWFVILQNVFRGYDDANQLSMQEIEAVPYVMQSIELLFVAWFLKKKDMRCCKNAVAIYNFVRTNAEKIIDTISL